MKAKLLGCKLVDFTPKGEEPIKGVKLFITYPDSAAKGLVCDSMFIRDGAQNVLLINPLDFIGKDVVVDFDRKGKVMSVSA